MTEIASPTTGAYKWKPQGYSSSRATCTMYMHIPPKF